MANIKIARNELVMKLSWNDDGKEISAESICHDEGSSFHYRFTRESGLIKNSSDLELMLPSDEGEFNSIESAKAWAEKSERGWIALSNERK